MKIWMKIRILIPVTRKKYDTDKEQMTSILQNLLTVIDGLVLADSQHSQVEYNLTKMVMQKAEDSKKNLNIPADNQDTDRSYR